MLILNTIQEQKQVSFKLVSWIVLSVALHALVLLITYQPNLPFTGQPALRIVLEERQPTVTSSLPPSPSSNVQPKALKEKPAKPSKQESIHKKVKVAVAKKISLAIPEKQASVMPAPTPATPPITTTQVKYQISDRQSAVKSIPATSNERKKLSKQLQWELAHHFNYPHLARRRDWQGEVILNVTLMRNGQLKDISIASSSGYGMLDRAALASLNKVGRLEHGPQQALSFEIPVIYQLLDG